MTAESKTIRNSSKKKGTETQAVENKVMQLQSFSQN